jgi:hypothetical protein
MRAVLPYTFTALHIPPNKTKPSKTHMIGYVNADVPELCERDVDVVAQWVTFNHDRRGQRRGCVSYDGDLYVEVAGWNNAPLLRLPASPGDRALDQVFGRDILGHETLSKSEMDLLIRAFSGELATKSFQTLTAVVETNQSRNEAIAKSCAESLLMIDGQVWRKVPWIGLELTQYLGGWKCDVAFAPVGFNDEGTDLSVFPYQAPGYVRRFALDEMERVRFHASGRELFLLIRELRSNDAPKTLSEEEFLLRSTRYAVRRTMEDVGNMSSEAVADWVALRAAYEARVSTAETPLPDDIAETLRRFTPTIVHERTREAMEETLAVLEIYSAEGQEREVVPSALWCAP